MKTFDILVRRKLAVGLLILLLGNGPASAQQGYQFLPSISVAQVYDDNLFLTPDSPVKDMITRMTPGFSLGFESVPVSWSIGYSFDAENYRDNSELNDEVIRQDGGASLQFASNENTQFSLDAGYLETETPGELNLDTGLERGRFNARRIFVSPALMHEFGPSTSVMFDYTRTEDRLSGEASVERHNSNISIDRALSEPTVISAGLGYREFNFSDYDSQDQAGAGDTSLDSQLLWLGISHEFNPVTGMQLQAGPRRTSGSTEPFVSLSLNRSYANGSFTVEYLRDETTLIGESGRREIETTGLRLDHQIGNDFELTLSPRYGKVSRSQGDTEVYRFDLEASYLISNIVSVTASWHYSTQDEIFTDNIQENISRNTFLLGIVIARPQASGSGN